MHDDCDGGLCAICGLRLSQSMCLGLQALIGEVLQLLFKLRCSACQQKYSTLSCAVDETPPSANSRSKAANCT